MWGWNVHHMEKLTLLILLYGNRPWNSQRRTQRPVALRHLSATISSSHKVNVFIFFPIFLFTNIIRSWNGTISHLSALNKSRATIKNLTSSLQHLRLYADDIIYRRTEFVTRTSVKHGREGWRFFHSRMWTAPSNVNNVEVSLLSLKNLEGSV